ncbi:MAG: DegV family protein [Anaerolineae bacterium]|nr:DegV family protein [Anaerolineae bacterium]
MKTLTPVAVITDSAAAIPAELLAQYQIGVVPIYVNMGRETFRSGIDLQPDSFYERLRAEPGLEIGTSVPSPSVFLNAYEKVSHWAKAIVAVHVAGRQSACCATAELAGRESSIPIVVVDSETTCMGEGFVVLEAAREAATGAPLERVVEKVRSLLPNVGLTALLESVTYAFKGGRLQSTVRAVGTFFNIQPLIRVQHNRVSLAGQVRRRSQGVKALLAKVLDEARDAPAHLAVHFAEDEDEGRNLLESLKAQINCVESYLTRVPIELGVHSGPGALAVSYYVERETLALKDQLSRLTEYAKEAIRSRLPGSTQKDSAES